MKKEKLINIGEQLLSGLGTSGGGILGVACVISSDSYSGVRQLKFPSEDIDIIDLGPPFVLRKPVNANPRIKVNMLLLSKLFPLFTDRQQAVL